MTNLARQLATEEKINRIVDQRVKEQVARSMEHWRRGLQQKVKDLETENTALKARLAAPDSAPTDTTAEPPQPVKTPQASAQSPTDSPSNPSPVAPENDSSVPVVSGAAGFSETEHAADLTAALQAARCPDIDLARRVLQVERDEDGELVARYGDNAAPLAEIAAILPDTLKPPSIRSGGSGMSTGNPPSIRRDELSGLESAARAAYNRVRINPSDTGLQLAFNRANKAYQTARRQKGLPIHHFGSE